ncbi:MAG TPA: winged helix-turn-helix domain-containing protein [Pyrinomonadaceae bacterium]|nr:winged helix-turn-helix domain-containing protein [Pyrinomonadaceae bacterium]
MLQTKKGCYLFGNFRLDPSKRVLYYRDHGESVAITPKVFETLLTLVEKQGEVVEKNTLIQRLWPDSYVEEGNLTYNISVLRKALGERPNEHRFIATVPGRGYMFVAEVGKGSGEKSNGKKNYPSRKAANSHGPEIDSLAVLPLVNADPDPASDYLSDGITERIIHSLSQLSQLRVLARNSVFHYKGKDIDAREVGKELGVRAVFLGRIINFEGKIIVRVELVDVTDGRQLWGGSYNCEASNIFKIEEDVSRSISGALKLKVTGRQIGSLGRNQTRDAAAYDYYLKGLYHWNNFVQEGAVKGIEYFRRAIEIDPQYALAHAAISDCLYRLSNISLPAMEVMPKAKEAALNAVEADNTLAEAHTAIAVVTDQYDWDWTAAEVEYRKALECNPNCVIAHQRYSRYLVRMGRFEEAITNLTVASELDPLSLLISVSKASLFNIARQHDQAIEKLRMVLELNSNFYLPRFALAQAYQFVGNFREAISEYEKALPLERSTEMLGRYGQALALAGRRDDALKVVREMKERRKKQYVSPYSIGLVYAGLGENSTALTWIDEAFGQRNGELTWLSVHPEVDGLRGEERFNILMRSMNLGQQLNVRQMAVTP